MVGESHFGSWPNHAERNLFVGQNVLGTFHGLITSSCSLFNEI